MDLPALEPCPYGRKKRHAIEAILPGDDDHDITLFCHYCGTLRRAAATGDLLVSRLDDKTAEEIVRWSTR
jgi:hypothetical protein